VTLEMIRDLVNWRAQRAFFYAFAPVAELSRMASVLELRSN
jgi:hypothetical protein